MKKEKRFEVIYKDGTMLAQRILVDKKTGVNYLFIAEGYAGGLTPLLDQDGKPIISTVSTLSREI